MRIPPRSWRMIRWPILAIVAALLLWFVLPLTPFAWWMLLDAVGPGSAKGHVLTEDCSIVDSEGKEIGRLTKGAVLYDACRHDLGHTDPDDIRFHKVYVRVGWTNPEPEMAALANWSTNIQPAGVGNVVSLKTEGTANHASQSIGAGPPQTER